MYNQDRIYRSLLQESALVRAFHSFLNDPILPRIEKLRYLIEHVLFGNELDSRERGSATLISP